MAQPKRAAGGQQTGRTGAGARTTKSTARGAQSAGARTRTRRATAEAKAGEPGVEAAAARIRELNERIIDTGKGAGRGTLDVARKLLRRAHHTLRELGDDALQPA